MKRPSRDRSGLVGILIAVIVIVIVIIAAIALFLIPFKSVSIDESRQVEFAPDVTSLSINISMDVGSVTVNFVNDSSVAASLHVSGTHRSGLLAPQRPVNVSWTVTNDTESMAIDLKIDMGRNIGFFVSNDIQCTLNISSQLRTALSVVSSLGGMNITTAEGVTLTGVDLRAAAGGIRMNMTSGTTLDGPLRLNTSLGGLDLRWTDLTATDNASVNLTASAGGIRLMMLQTSDLGSNMTVRSTAQLGGIDLTLDVWGNNSARVQSHADLGGVRVEQRNGFNGTDEDIASINYPANYNLDIRSNASAGGVNSRLNYAEQ